MKTVIIVLLLVTPLVSYSQFEFELTYHYHLEKVVENEISSYKNDTITWEPRSARFAYVRSYTELLKVYKSGNIEYLTIDGVDLDSIEFDSLIGLKSLHLENCKIENLQFHSVDLLEEIWIGDCSTVSSSISFKNCSALTKLKIDVFSNRLINDLNFCSNLELLVLVGINTNQEFLEQLNSLKNINYLFLIEFKYSNSQIDHMTKSYRELFPEANIAIM
jgi:hypothetical protein